MAAHTARPGSREVLELSGRLDAYAAPAVVGWLADRTTGATGPVRIVVDLGAVHFVDSTALAALVQGMKHCRQTGGDLRLCGLQQPVRIIVELTRLDRAFAIYATREEADVSFDVA